GNTDITGKYAEYGYVASLAPGSAGAGKNAVGRNSLGPVRPPEGTYPVDFREMAKKNRTGSFAP
ncbi:MAG: hypothetical protein LBC60_09700, partial [Spirochaetaceae bacterium]|nr:hypothetical protein [Spirochaetaceae bacterium]